MSSGNSTLRQQLTGVLPPITMPFDMKGELVKGGLREQRQSHCNSNLFH
jgi:hypothetical protein